MKKRVILDLACPSFRHNSFLLNVLETTLYNFSKVCICINIDKIYFGLAFYFCNSVIAIN